MLSFQNNIRALVLPAGQTAMLQPLDATVFGSLKKKYRDHLRREAISENPVSFDNDLRILIWF